MREGDMTMMVAASVRSAISGAVCAAIGMTANNKEEADNEAVILSAQVESDLDMIVAGRSPESAINYADARLWLKAVFQRLAGKLGEGELPEKGNGDLATEAFGTLSGLAVLLGNGGRDAINCVNDGTEFFKLAAEELSLIRGMSPKSDFKALGQAAGRVFRMLADISEGKEWRTAGSTAPAAETAPAPISPAG